MNCIRCKKFVQISELNNTSNLIIGTKIECKNCKYLYKKHNDIFYQIYDELTITISDYSYNCYYYNNNRNNISVYREVYNYKDCGTYPVKNDKALEKIFESYDFNEEIKFNNRIAKSLILL